MPTYTFRCHKCDHVFEKIRKMDDRNDPISNPCPNCEDVGSITRQYDAASWVDPGILKADQNMEKSGVLKELNRLKKHHPYMKWKG